MLELYRSALRIRRAESSFGDGELTWLDLPEGALGFRRGDDLVCVVNLSADPVELPEGGAQLLVSADLSAVGRLSADTAVWLKFRT